LCGIAGFYAFGGDGRPDVLERMTQSLVHRGPDDHGFVAFGADGRADAWQEPGRVTIDAAVGLGSRRLRIIDLSEAGHQPMTEHSRRYWLAYNGEIYNFVELRAELERSGHAFVGHCDAEVILHAFAEWGTECFRRFNGMWALALYDTRERTLALSRDRFGVKPLYVHRNRGNVVFGSEVKALLEFPGVPKRPNHRTVYNYVARHYRCVDGGRESFYEGIEHLLPGHFWVIGPDGGVEESRYWNIDPARRTHRRTDTSVLEEFRELFDDAVRIRLRADVPVATLLSGGIDSSSVTCAAAHASSEPVAVFSARFDEPEFDEGAYIEPTVAHLGAKATYIYPRATELVPTLQRMLAQHDEPICTATWYAHWLLMEEIGRTNVPVVLNGHAGDELFAGYWDHYLYNFADLEAGDPAGLAHEYASWLTNHNRDPLEYERFKRDVLGRSDEERWTLYDDVATPELRAGAAPLDRVDLFAARGHLSSRLYKELAYETVPATLRPEDRNSMAFSIEARSPFLDYRLAEFAFSLSNDVKIRHGIGKWAIREGMRGLVPDAVLDRRDKQGWNAPTNEWFRGAGRGAVAEVLEAPSALADSLVHREVVLQKFAEHASGKANHAMAIWQWLNFRLWLRGAFEGTPA
jgi:asparagine synthase (glutamine-hydrolysing)